MAASSSRRSAIARAKHEENADVEIYSKKFTKKGQFVTGHTYTARATTVRSLTASSSDGVHQITHVTAPQA